ncbi:cystathionine beta-lyase [Carex littledalei]|uniref:cysteine-S-conjugate beta-lyase n=1 Tax=Carex littledalei TaxID=544730 RepID=A0A833VLW7_9POAL|nr:cystathionine beta-lyase [Carex littledalei]
MIKNLVLFLFVFLLQRISEIAHAHGALVLVDNSIMSPVLSQPLELGADIVMHSATKFIAGHSDLMAGILAVKGESLVREIAFLQNAVGTGLAPFDCCLCLRGIKTMALRVEKQQAKGAGSVKSLISLPCFMSHASIPASVREARGLTEDLVRISVGIEDVEDLINDLDYAISSGPK